MKCLQCNKEFESKRATAKYCSAKCRKLAFQNISVPQVSVLTVPAVSVPAVSVPEKIVELVIDSAMDNTTDNSQENLPQDLNIHDFAGDVNAYQAYVRERNKQTRERIANTPISVLKASGQFIPCWRVAK